MPFPLSPEKAPGNFGAVIAAPKSELILAMHFVSLGQQLSANLKENSTNKAQIWEWWNCESGQAPIPENTVEQFPPR